MERLHAYLPMDRRWSLARDERLDEQRHGAVLFGDISGFTTLTNDLGRALGVQRLGSEEIGRQLERVFEPLIAFVHDYGGSVIGFSGDALTCWFDGVLPADAADQPPSARAIACAVAMQRAMSQLTASAEHAGAAGTLALKVSVAAGSAKRWLVGDPDIQVLEVLAGRLLDTVAAGERLAAPGEVLASPAAIEEAGGRVICSAWRDASDGGAFGVVDAVGTVQTAPWPTFPDDISDRLEERAGPWLLPRVFEHLQRGHGEFLEELRPAVPWFLRFGGVDYDRDDAGEQLDAFVRWVQALVHDYEGALFQLTIGDKGSYLNGAFGVPIAHQDDAARAVSAAVELLSPPAPLSFVRDIQIGLARGQVYAGRTGGPQRRCYVVIGEKVNLAARLMEAAPPGQVRCDTGTVRAAAGRWTFDAGPPLRMKGFDTPIELHRPVDRTAHGTTLVGREAELAMLRAALSDPQSGARRVFLVEGEPGIGKSKLASAFQGEALLASWRCFHGWGDPIQSLSPYHAWRPIFRLLFALEGGGAEHSSARSRSLSPREREGVLAAAVQLVPACESLLPLLNAVLPLDLSDSELTAQMTGEVRLENTQRLLVSLLSAAATPAGGTIVMEDSQWLDSASWALLRRVSREVSPLVLVVLMQPHPESSDLKALRTQEETTAMRLEPMAGGAIEQLVRERFGVRSVPAPIVALLHEKGGGNPLFVEQLAYALRDQGMIHMVDGECRLSAEASRLSEVSLPDNILGLITSRIDRLSPALQAVLKTASVIGPAFSLRAVREVHPIAGDLGHLDEYLATLASLDITALAKSEPEPVFAFKHNTMQAAAYQLMAFNQRRQLHRSLAEWYERSGTEGDAHDALLAHHWSCAEVPEKAWPYMDRAGEHALTNSAYQEAVRFFGDLLALHPRLKDATAAKRRWVVKLAQAYRGWGHFQESRNRLAEAAALYGHPLPGGRVSMVRGIVAETLRQTARRLVFRRASPRRFAEPATLLEEGQVYQLLSELSYFANQKGLSLYGSLRWLNLAEAAGEGGRDLAVAYASMGLLAGIFKLRRPAEFYHARAQAIASREGQPPLLADVLRLDGAYRVCTGEWEKVRPAGEKARDIHAALADSRHWGDCMAMLAHTAYFTGDFATCERLCADLERAAVAAKTRIHQIWGLTWGGESAYRLGRPDVAQERLEEALRLTADEPEVSAELCGDAYLAAIHWQRGDVGRARQRIESFNERTTKLETSPSTYTLIDAYGALADVCVEMVEAGHKAALETASNAARALRRSARLFPIGQPVALLHEGRVDWVSDRQRRAWRKWQRCVDAGNRLGMPYEKARAQHELGRRGPGNRDERVRHFAAAHAAFERMGVPSELERLLRAAGLETNADTTEKHA